MLQTIREHSHGWIMGVILFLICIPFALWGISSYIGVGSRVVVAEVNGQELGLGQFQRTYQDFRLRMQATFGERFNPNLISDELIKNQPWSNWSLTRFCCSVPSKPACASVRPKLLRRFERSGRFKLAACSPTICMRAF